MGYRRGVTDEQRRQEAVVRAREWREKATPEQIESIRARGRRYYAENRAKVLDYQHSRKPEMAAYNRTRLAENRAYRATDPWGRARDALTHSRAKARKYGLDVGTLTKELFARLHLLPCAYCGLMPCMGADHVIPMSRGGPNTVENLVPACLPCNVAKGAKV